MKKLQLNFLIILACAFGINANAQSDTMKTVQVGTQTWTQYNLSVTTFRNGDTILHASNKKEWEAANRAKKPAWCHYNFDSKTAATYGVFYNFYAVNDPRVLAPNGFHIPVTEEWRKMQEFVQTTYKGDEGKFVKQAKTWKGGVKATNETGLSFLPSGLANWDGLFPYKNTHAYFWTANPLTPKNEAFYAFFPTGTERIYLQRDLDLGCGMSVRCIKD